MWSVWDKKTEINGYPPDHFFEVFKNLVNEEVIYIKEEGGIVVCMEGKSILANLHGIDPTLTNDEFIAEYERILAEPVEETVEEN